MTALTDALTDDAPAGGLLDHLNAAAAPEEPPARRQPGVLVEYVTDGAAAPVQVRITNRDRIAYEKALARHKEWPTQDHGQHFAMTFHVWSAARRAGLTSATFEQFQEQLEDYDVVKDVPADPTR